MSSKSPHSIHRSRNSQTQEVLIERAIRNSRQSLSLSPREKADNTKQQSMFIDFKALALYLKSPMVDSESPVNSTKSCNSEMSNTSSDREFSRRERRSSQYAFQWHSN